MHLETEGGKFIMRKIILSNYITLNGFFEGPQRELDWFVWDDDMADYSKELLKRIDTMLFGRVTYELMAAYWPGAAAEDPVIKNAMNTAAKIVFSRTLPRAEWNNTTLIREAVPDEIKKMKERPGKDMVIFGSSGLASTLAGHGLIDEYRIVVNPVIVGRGNPLFSGMPGRIALRLLEARPFKCGNIMLCYEPSTPEVR
jgi:dihydrofolate reductase